MSESKYVVGVDLASGSDHTEVSVVGATADGRTRTVDELLPVEVVPFNDMAAFFGAAGTVMAHLQRQGVYYTSESHLRFEMEHFFRFKPKAFRDKVVDMVVAYYKTNPFNREDWMAAVEEKQVMYRMGRSSISEHSHNLTPGALQKLREIWP